MEFVLLWQMDATLTLKVIKGTSENSSALFQAPFLYVICLHNKTFTPEHKYVTVFNRKDQILSQLGLS